MKQPAQSNTVVGWREWVSLPDAGLDWIKAKLDTGAQTSALHVIHIEEFERDGHPWVRGLVRPWQHSWADEVAMEWPVRDVRRVRGSSGHAGRALRRAADDPPRGARGHGRAHPDQPHKMGFRMLIGREALRHGFLVDSHASFLGGRAPKAIRRRNNGLASEPD